MRIISFGGRLVGLSAYRREALVKVGVRSGEGPAKITTIGLRLRVEVMGRNKESSRPVLSISPWGEFDGDKGEKRFAAECAASFEYQSEILQAYNEEPDIQVP